MIRRWDDKEAGLIWEIRLLLQRPKTHVTVLQG